MAMSPPGRCQLRFGAHRCFEFAKSRGEGCEKGRNMPGIIRNHQNKNRVNKNQRSWRGPRDGNSNGLMIPECAGVSKGWTMEIAIDKFGMCYGAPLFHTNSNLG